MVGGLGSCPSLVEPLARLLAEEDIELIHGVSDSPLSACKTILEVRRVTCLPNAAMHYRIDGVALSAQAPVSYCLMLLTIGEYSKHRDR